MSSPFRPGNQSVYIFLWGIFQFNILRLRELLRYSLRACSKKGKSGVASRYRSRFAGDTWSIKHHWFARNAHCRYETNSCDGCAWVLQIFVFVHLEAHGSDPTHSKCCPNVPWTPWRRSGSSFATHCPCPKFCATFLFVEGIQQNCAGKQTCLHSRLPILCFVPIRFSRCDMFCPGGRHVTTN